MKPEDYIKRAEEMGYTVVSQSSLDPSNLWVWAGDGRQILKSFKRDKKRRKKTGMPAVQYVNEAGPGNGKFRYHTYGRKTEEYIPDYADERAREEWPDYVVDHERGSEGPKPFRNSAEKKEYQDRFGLRPYEEGEEKQDHRRRKKNANP